MPNSTDICTRKFWDAETGREISVTMPIREALILELLNKIMLAIKQK